MGRYLGEQLVLPEKSSIANPPVGYIALFNKNGTITFKNSSGTESTGGGGSNTIPTWQGSTAYIDNQVIAYQGILFLCHTAHTSATLFSETLDKWESMAQGVVIFQKVGHGWAQFEALYKASGVWEKATASTVASVSSHILLEYSTDWVLAASIGEYEYTSHGLSTGLYYANATFISQNPDGDYEDAVLEVTGPNTVRVIAFMPAIKRIAPADDPSIATNVRVTTSGFTGNLDALDITVQDVANKVDQFVLGGAKVEDWAGSTTYHAGDVVRYNGIPLFCPAQHASTTFAADLTNWRSLYGFDEIVTQNAHGFTRWKPIYYNGATWVAANSSAAASLATHVVLESSTNTFLAVSHGVYTYASHGLTVGALYLNGAAVLSTIPDLLENAVLQVRDANTVEVVSYLPAVRRHEADTLLSDFVLIDRLVVTGGTLNTLVALTLAYKWIKVVGRVSSASSGDLLLRPNDDATAGNYVSSVQSFNGTATTNAAGSYAGLLCGHVGSTAAAPCLGETLIGVDMVSGEYRASRADMTYMEGSAQVGLSCAAYWTDTSAAVTSLRFLYGTGAESVTCDIQIFGKV
jgi:hypothetical protein